MTQDPVLEPAEPAPPSPGERLRAVLAVPGRLLGALFLPDRWVPRMVVAGRARAAFLFVMAAAFAAALAVGDRLDMRQAVMMRMAMMESGVIKPEPGAPPAPRLSDREIEEQIAKEKKTTAVLLALKAGLWTPIGLVLLGVFVAAAGRFVGGKTRWGPSLTAATLATLPSAVNDLVTAAAVLGRTSVTPMDLPGLVGAGFRIPLAGPFSVDPFFLWSVIILGFGLAAAAGISRTRAFVTTFACAFLFLLLTVPVPGPKGFPMPPQGRP